MEKLTITVYTEDFLSSSWIWLNDPEIMALTNTRVFSREDQLAWYNMVLKSEDYKVWGIRFDGTKIGVLGLKGLSDGKAEYFGFIGEKSFWNRGISKYMLDFALEYAKNRKIELIWLQVVKDNQRAIRAYERYGFSRTAGKDGMEFMEMKINAL